MKIEGINKKLIGIACEFYGMEILLDRGYFHDKKDKELFKGYAEYGNKGNFYVWWNTKDLKYFRHWIEDINFKNIEANTWNSFDYKSSSHLCEDSYGKYGLWFKSLSDHKNGLELHHRLSEKEMSKVHGFYGEDYIENNVDSGYRGCLPEKIRFFYNDFTFDFFERNYSPFKTRKKRYNVNVWNWTIGHYTQRLQKDIKSGSFQAEYYWSNAVSFPKKYKMRYKTKKTLKDRMPKTFYDETIAKKMDSKIAVKKWSYIIKKLTYPYK